ncbi:MAG: YdeI/OmpD-associated family protein [Arcticibacter sp.]
MNPSVDKYLLDGCMRCKYGATPKCKVLKWTQELIMLRKIVLDTGLTEAIKWGVPVYMHQGKNVITVNALKDSANIGFFKGVLLNDTKQLLQQQGNIQSARIIRFYNTSEILKLKAVLKSYILEAIAIEESGRKVVTKQNPEPIPTELLDAFEDDPALKTAFFKLTPGRQRGYIIHISSAKQSQTRMSRIERYKHLILEGIGINDK